MFEQYFNFTSGSLYVVQGGVCSYYAFPGLNLESEIETLFRNHTTYLGRRGPDTHLVMINNTNLGSQLQFVYYNTESKIITNLQAYDFTLGTGFSAAYTTPIEFYKEHSLEFFDVPSSCFNQTLTARQVKAPQAFNLFYFPEKFENNSE